MLALTIVLTLLGLAFSVVGYFIYFRKKYSLINGFTADCCAGRKDEAYAKRVGLIELAVGIGCLIAGAFLMFIT